ncbi:uncharacterized protein VDAG_08197 [Verticillium dahliae VdLs.17]|uniref:Uncharacterized protein n=1 Tax=Verticillium dahliae (strain VdLs.17 / ATCC MYA-4575 / FGSC 10137) TaxID=498257 RepID=G2XDG5_VERDV|nr:uncharacterized protein VDAG_08197 [Verticillium dahliae VdLs.17]EGY17033.1 hypothetical protein VDAG_08197 [Verticillium dahliae VdLs.17]KAH6696089.1 hypothetical protein EV126DRAFT_67990 [Verticillium dahliae]
MSHNPAFRTPVGPASSNSKCAAPSSTLLDGSSDAWLSVTTGTKVGHATTTGPSFPIPSYAFSKHAAVRLLIVASCTTTMDRGDVNPLAPRSALVSSSFAPQLVDLSSTMIVGAKASCGTAKSPSSGVFTNSPDQRSAIICRTRASGGRLSSSSAKRDSEDVGVQQRT